MAVMEPQTMMQPVSGNNQEIPSDQSELKTGVVKFFIDEKGYGFITAEDGNDYFVHFKAIQMTGHKSLAIGEQVEFTVATDPTTQKLAAQNVTGPGGATPQGCPQGKGKGKGKSYGGYAQQDPFYMGNNDYGQQQMYSNQGYGGMSNSYSNGYGNMQDGYQPPFVSTPTRNGFLGVSTPISTMTGYMPQQQQQFSPMMMPQMMPQMAMQTPTTPVWSTQQNQPTTPYNMAGSDQYSSA